jgi:hypothetical protein
MHPPEIITRLHAAFRAFDESAGPQGLYAINEYQAGAHPHPDYLADWRLIIRPTLERLEYRAPRKIHPKHFEAGRFTALGVAKFLDIELVHCSKIKVRLYGDTYRVDPHRDFSERWEKLRLAGRIRSHARRSHTRPFTNDERLLLLIGFDTGPRPFHHEFSELHDKLGATEQSAIFTTDHWPDPHGRGFETLCASWYWPGEQHDTTS